MEGSICLSLEPGGVSRWPRPHLSSSTMYIPKSWSPQTKDSEGWVMGRPTEVEGQRVETTVPVWLHNMVGSNWGWASGVSFIPGVDDPDNCVSVCG